MTTISEHDQVVLADLHEGEKAYPIYEIDVRWSQAIVDQENLPTRFTEGLPEGRLWDRAGWDRMEREDRDLEAIKAELVREWWPQYVEKNKLPEPADLTITVELIRHDVWCDGWFSHWTFDVGMDDEAVLASFERYVDRIECSPLPDKEGILMGAEDRWRWSGCADGDPQRERTDPPCRCPGCKKQGIVRIDH